MKIFKMALLGLLIISVYAQGAKWKKIKPLKAYPGSAYNLKENVAYMEIRRYPTRKSKKASETWALYRKSLKSYSEDIIIKFKGLTPKYSQNADMNFHGNAFFIDTEGKMFQMDMKKDIISLLGEIDTPVEVQLVLWLTAGTEGQYYRKVAKGYETKVSYLLKGCMYGQDINLINNNIDFNNAKFSLFRKGCKNRKHTRFIINKKISYEYYSAISIDRKGNLYVIGKVEKNKNTDRIGFYVLDKYNNNGKKLWSRELNGVGYIIDPKIVTEDYTVYISGDEGLVAKYSFTGKKQSLSKGDRSIFGKKTDKKAIKKQKYLPEGLPDPKNGIEATINAYVKDKKNNVYVVGNEVFYPSGSPDEVPEGECGNVETISGALIAKLNSNGETVWAKVIDWNE
jgi:hypothetical protein